MKKFNLLLPLMLAMSLSTNIVRAQTFAPSTEKTQEKAASVTADVTVDEPVKTDTAGEIESIINTETPPSEMTPEQKAAIDLNAKKSIHSSLKARSVRERKDFIDVMTTAEKIKTRRAALAAGQSDDEAAKAESKIAKPEVNPASNSDMEQYLYEKANLTNEK